MNDKYGRSVRTRRRALDLTQTQLGEAIGRNQSWVARLENLHCRASETCKRRIEAYLHAHAQAQASATRVAQWSASHGTAR
jgi:predicted transcriptional regulator